MTTVQAKDISFTGGSGPVVVLGGGWVGSGVAVSVAPSRTAVVTHRTAATVEANAASGVPAVVFDIGDDSTWDNLPKEKASLVLITFALSAEEHGEKLKALVKLMFETKRIDKDTAFILISTTSVFRVPKDEMNAAISEDAPLDGIGVYGKPLTDRVEGEALLMEAVGATVLHVSGLSGRKPWPPVLEYFRTSGTQFVNSVALEDVCAMVRLFSDRRAAGERLIVSGGKFSMNDVAKALNVDPLEGKLSPSGTKRMVSSKLKAYLPKDEAYRWAALDVNGIPIEAVAGGMA